jgi:hypothetical protein
MPFLPEGYGFQDVDWASHSHLTGIDEISFDGERRNVPMGNALRPSGTDIGMVFRMYSNNIISGPLGSGTRNPMGVFLPSPNGHAIYRNGVLSLTITEKVANRLLKNMQF